MVTLMLFSLEVSITTPSGDVKTQECLAGADIVVQVGDEVTKDEPITTNPNVGGFGQEGFFKAIFWGMQHET